MIATEQRRWLALALLCAVQFMVVLDIAIVNVALPSIQVDLGFSQENLQWVISAYALIFGGFLLLGGRQADILGRRKRLHRRRDRLHARLAALRARVGRGLADRRRAIQGLGAAIISPAALAILMTTFREGRERNIALGAWGAVGGFGAAAGVLLGGVLTDALSWEWIFFVNIPVGLVAPGARARAARREPRPRGRSASTRSGALLVTAGLVAARLRDHGGERASAGRPGRRSRSSPARSACSARSRPGSDADRAPLVPFSIFRIRTLAGSNVGRLPHGDDAVLDVPAAHALHAAGARLLGAEDRRRVPRRAPAPRSSGQTSPRSS